MCLFSSHYGEQPSFCPSPLRLLSSDSLIKPLHPISSRSFHYLQMISICKPPHICQFSPCQQLTIPLLIFLSSVPCFISQHGAMSSLSSPPPIPVRPVWILSTIFLPPAIYLPHPPLLHSHFENFPLLIPSLPSADWFFCRCASEDYCPYLALPASGVAHNLFYGTFRRPWADNEVLWLMAYI